MDQEIREAEQTAKSYVGAGVGALRAPINQAIAKEKAAIDHEVGVLHQALENAHTLLGALEAAVSPVSTPIPPSDSAPAHEAVGSSRVYNAIHEAASSVHIMQDRLQSVLRNLEV